MAWWVRVDLAETVSILVCNYNHRHAELSTCRIRRIARISVLLSLRCSSSHQAPNPIHQLTLPLVPPIQLSIEAVLGDRPLDEQQDRQGCHGSKKRCGEVWHAGSSAGVIELASDSVDEGNLTYPKADIRCV